MIVNLIIQKIGNEGFSVPIIFFYFLFLGQLKENAEDFAEKESKEGKIEVIRVAVVVFAVRTPLRKYFMQAFVCFLDYS